MIKGHVKEPQSCLWCRGFFRFSPFPVTFETTPAHSIYVFGCLLRIEWKMEKVPSVVCLMTGFFSSNHTEVVPGRSPHLLDTARKNIVFQLPPSSSGAGSHHLLFCRHDVVMMEQRHPSTLLPESHLQQLYKRKI